MPRIALQLSEAMAWSQVMNLLRDLRRNAGLTQQGFADLIDTPVNTFRMWDSGLRPVPAQTYVRTRSARHECPNARVAVERVRADQGDAEGPCGCQRR